jgi:hypothetical protein
MTDEQLKQALKMLQDQGNIKIAASDDVPSVHEASLMEPPRGDYSKRPDQFSKIKEVVRNLPSSMKPDENFKPTPDVTVDTKYAGESQPVEESDYQKTTDSIKQKFIDNPNFNSIENFEKLRKRYGK